jgi:hypothetical protein
VNSLPSVIPTERKATITIQLAPRRSDIIKEFPTRETKQNPQLHAKGAKKILSKPETKTPLRCPFKTFQLIPHRNVKNEKISQFAEVITDSYSEIFKRILEGREEPDRVFFETIMTNKTYQTFITTNTDLSDMVKQQSQVVWKGVTIQDVQDPLKGIEAKSLGYEMKLKYHNFMSLMTDKKVTVMPLGEILEISQFMRDEDRVFIQFGFQAAEETWYKEADEDRKIFEKKPPKKWGKKDLNNSSLMKTTQPGFDFVLRVIVESPDERRKSRIARGIILSLKQLNYDNELIEKQVKPSNMKKWLNDVIKREIKIPFLLGRRQIITPLEIAHFIKLPQRNIQEEYPIIEVVNGKETTISDVLTKGGIELGQAMYRGKPITVYSPINNHDQLCLPTTVIGGMGSGKTKGYGCNRAIGFVKDGFSSLMVDPAKSEMWEEIEKALPANQRRRILLGKDVISLDFREVLHSESARGRLSQIILSFFEDNTDAAGAQTQRFLRAAVMGMQTGKLREIMTIFTDKKYRDKVISKMKDGMHKETLQEFNGYKPDRQRQILAPILNRLDVILGDPYLEKCMEADDGIDMVEILSKRRMCTVIDVPDRYNTREAKDVLINLISFKIDAAMSLRKDEFPFAIIYDEPHQYMKSAKLWKNVAVESRKYRLAYTWLFHSWEQIPNSLGQIIKDAGPHYIIYSSSKGTYRGLLEEISPYTVEDGLNTKKYHAICALRFGDQRITPFVANMTPPPSMRTPA